MRFVTLEEARASAGIKLVVAALIPSVWSESAKGILHVKGIDAALVRYSSSDVAVREWMGWHNVPVLMVPGEPIRTQWAEILESAERIGGGAPLVPRDDELRMRLFGLGHELLGPNGLVWSMRLLVVHRGIVTDGKEGFPLKIAQYLAPKYGYATEHVEAARARIRSIFDRFAKLLEGRTYALGDALSALDIYIATAVEPFAQLPEALSPGTHAVVRHAFATAAPDLSNALPSVLRAHRDRIYEKHLELPIRL